MIAKLTCTHSIDKSDIFDIKNCQIIEGCAIGHEGAYLLLPFIGIKTPIFLNNYCIKNATKLWFNNKTIFDNNNIEHGDYVFYVVPYCSIISFYGNPEDKAVEFYNDYYFKYLDDSDS